MPSISNLFILLILAFNFASSKASTSDPLEHLSLEENKRLSIFLMELVVEYEAINKQNPFLDNYSLLKKVRKLKEVFLIPGAYASENPEPEDDRGVTSNHEPSSFDVMGRVIKTGRPFCIYQGGWGSFLKSKEEPICVSPYTIFKPRSSDKEDVDQCKIKNEKNISCNPAIFGYQDLKRERLFCVSETSPSANAECMDYALGKTFSPGADLVEKRLKWLSEQNSSDGSIKKSYEDLYKNIYKMCLCTDTRFVETTSDNQKKIVPTKSCFSLITMISEAKGCTNFKDSTVPSNELDIIKKIRDLSAEYLSDGSKDIEKKYTELIKESSKKLKKDLNLICENGKDGGNINEKPEKPTLKIEGSKKADEVSLKAVVSVGDWEFNWWKETTSTSKKIAGLAGDSDDSDSSKKDENQTNTKKEPLGSEKDSVVIQYEEESFKVCLEAKLVKEDFTDHRCYTVPSKAEREKEVEDSKPIPISKPTPVGGPQLPKSPTPQLRQGVDFSRSGVL